MTDLTAPGAPVERIAQLDVLRGIAILGILMVNAQAFALPAEVMGNPRLSPLPFEPADQAVWWTMRTFFEGKFINLFSLLFGVSLFLVGGVRDDPVREPVLVRRLIWLTVFGVIHGALIWYGDILLHYALIGFLMFLFRSWPARRLITFGVVWLLVASVIYLAFHLVMEAVPSEPLERGMRTEIARGLVGFRGSLAEVQSANAVDWAAAAFSALLVQGPRTLGLMMLGLGLYKSGFLGGEGRSRAYAVLIAAGAAALMLVGSTAALELQGRAGSSLGLAALPNSLLSPVVTLGYVALVVVALKRGAGRALGRVLTPVGRMAFTNYLTQSLIMTVIFYGGGRGFGWFGRLDWAEWIWIVLAIWALQLVWSPLWLSRFTMGPFEWVWRRLSYGRDIPLRRRDGLEPAAVPSA